MQVTITGASGFIGKRLVSALESSGHRLTIVGRAPRAGSSPNAQFAVWDPERGLPPPSAVQTDAIVHLAGEPVSQRWSPKVKQRIRDSRVAGTLRLVEAMSQVETKPKVLVCASAVGYYGDRDDEILNEQAKPGTGFLPEVCVEWERAALTAQQLGIRVVLVRIGLVLGAGGGALQKMLPPFKAGVGGKLGSGEQWMPWIHLDDMVGLFQTAVEDDRWSGPINGSAPNPVRNTDFTAAIGRALRRPAIFPVPKFVVKLLYGEMADILFFSQRMIPEAATRLGYQFRYPQLFGALRSILG